MLKILSKIIVKHTLNDFLNFFKIFKCLFTKNMLYFNHFQNHFQTFSIQLFESTNLGERDRHLLSLVLMGGICFSPWRLGWGPKWSVAWNLIYMLKVVALNFTVQSHPFAD